MVQPEKSKRASHPVHRLRSEEAGVAVLTVLLAIVLLLILSSALFLTARLALERAAQTTDSTRALNVAESGMEAAANAIIELYDDDWGAWMGKNGTVPGSLAGGGDYSVNWYAQTALPWFDMTATGYYPSRDNATGVRRITAQVFVLNPWDFQYADGMAGRALGIVHVTGPFYVNNDLSMSGTAGVYQGPLIIHDPEGDARGSKLILKGSADIGSADSYVPLFIDGGRGQVTNDNPYYADPVYDWAPELEFPPLGEDEFRNYRYDTTNVYDDDKESGKFDGKTALVFDSHTESSQSSLDSGDLLGERVSWDSDEDGNITITFDNSDDTEGRPVYPILFVDGTVTFKDKEQDQKIDIRYKGKGTIVANGKISVTGSLVPTKSSLGQNRNSDTTLEGFPEINRLGLITRTEIAYEGGVSDWLAAALYGGGTVSFSKQGNFMGSTVTRILDLSEGEGKGAYLHTQAGFSGMLPPGMPGGDGRITSIMGWTEMTPPSPEASN